MARRKRTQQVGLAGAEAAAPIPEQPVVALAQVEAQEIPSAGPKEWRVVREARVSLFGHLTTLAAGTVVSVASYGPDGVARIRAQQVELEPVA